MCDGISEAILNEWKRQAAKDGNLEDYEYYLGMIHPPLPYRRWKLKYDKLLQIQAMPGYKEGRDDIAFSEAEALCIELGY